MVGEVDEKKLTIIEHLQELRSRLVICVIAVVITTIISLLFVPQILEIIKRPAPEGFQPIYTEMTGGLNIYFKVAIMSGIALALPVIVYQVVRFIAPALTPDEKRYFIILLPGVVIAFATGLAFGYFFVVPFTAKYLLTSFNGIATPFITVGNYVSFISTMLFWIGLSFESPIIIFFLAKVRILSPKKLAAYRKYAIVLAFVIAAAITPSPDPITQTIVAIPLLALYEIGVLLARFA